MSDTKSISVLSFSGMKDRFTIWSDKFLAKVKLSDFKDILFCKTKIPKSDDEISRRVEEGKKLSRIADLKSMAYTVLPLSIDVRNIRGKVVFGINKVCKSKEYTCGDSTLAWKKLKFFYPVSPSSLMKTERAFRQRKNGEG